MINITKHFLLIHPGLIFFFIIIAGNEWDLLFIVNLIIWLPLFVLAQGYFWQVMMYVGSLQDILALLKSPSIALKNITKSDKLISKIPKRRPYLLRKVYTKELSDERKELLSRGLATRVFEVRSKVMVVPISIPNNVYGGMIFVHRSVKGGGRRTVLAHEVGHIREGFKQDNKLRFAVVHTSIQTYIFAVIYATDGFAEKQAGWAMLPVLTSVIASYAITSLFLKILSELNAEHFVANNTSVSDFRNHRRMQRRARAIKIRKGNLLTKIRETVWSDFETCALDGEVGIGVRIRVALYCCVVLFAYLKTLTLITNLLLQRQSTAEAWDASIFYLSFLFVTTLGATWVWRKIAYSRIEQAELLIQQKLVR